MPPRAKATAAKPTEQITQIDLPPTRRGLLTIPILGVSPVIPHKWSEKAVRQMRIKQSEEAATKPKHDPKDPEAEAEASLYRLGDGRPGLPAAAFKGAIVGAARLFAGITMIQLKVAVTVLGEGQDQLVPIEGDMTLREDLPRNANGNPDLRYRYAFMPWSTTLRVEFNEQLISPRAVYTLLDAAGDGGVGDWRPSAPKSNTGMYGRFQVAAQ